MTDKKAKKNYISLDFFVNKSIINKIVEDCVEDGIIDYMLAKIYKEVLLVDSYTGYVEPARFDDGSVDVIETFKIIRKDGHYDRFVKEYERKHLIEFETFLDLELKQTAQMQRDKKSIANVLENALNKLIDKIPNEEEMVKMMSKLDGIDMGKIEELKKIMGVDK